MTEYLDMVNEHDEVIGKALKEHKKTERFISRNVAIFIRDSSGKYIIIKRSDDKEVFPGLFDLGACGHVQAGETYEEAAKREVFEELGIKCTMKFLAKKFTNLTHKREPWQFFTGIFLGEHDGEITLNQESQMYTKMSLQELERQMKAAPDSFVPAFHDDVREVRHLLQ